MPHLTGTVFMYQALLSFGPCSLQSVLVPTTHRNVVFQKLFEIPITIVSGIQLSRVIKLAAHMSPRCAEALSTAVCGDEVK